MIDLAVQILAEAVDVSSKTKVDTVPVRLALRVLMPHCPERWTLVMFWDGASGDNEIARYQSTNAALNKIMLQLRQSGVWGDQAPN